MRQEFPELLSELGDPYGAFTFVEDIFGDQFDVQGLVNFSKEGVQVPGACFSHEKEVEVG